MRHIRYEIAFYVAPDEYNPVRDYLFNEKNKTDLSVMINVIQRLGRVGQALIDTNSAKHLEGSIYELRKNRHRILYAQVGSRFVLLSAFLKSSRKTPRVEIERAKRHLADYRRTGKCQIMRQPVNL